jgi:hypothetical protein
MTSSMLRIDQYIVDRKLQTSILGTSTSVRKISLIGSLSCALVVDHSPTPAAIDSYCCERCVSQTAEFCCDICHPVHFTFPATEPNDKPPRAIRKYMPKEYVRGPTEKALRVALVSFRCELAAEILPEQSFITPQSLMSNTLVDRIVDLAHYQVLKTTADLRDQVTWAFLDTHGTKVVNLVHQFCPPRIIPLFTTAPLQRMLNTATSASGSVPVTTNMKGKRKCKSCGVEGHYREFPSIAHLHSIIDYVNRKDMSD